MALTLITVIFVVTGVNANCLNHNKEKVDWWFIYRVPRKASKSIYGDIVHSKYAYYDSNTKGLDYLHVHGEHISITKPGAKRKNSDHSPPKEALTPNKKISFNKAKRRNDELDSAEEEAVLHHQPKKRRIRKPNSGGKQSKKKDPDWNPRYDGGETDDDDDEYRRRLVGKMANTLADENNPLYHTFAPFFTDKKENNENPKWRGFAYSDDPPHVPAADTDKAHAKGVLLYNPSDNKEGFWLIHSLPNYPDLSAKKYSYGTNAAIDGDTTYGQTFLCISLKNEETINLAIHQIWAMHANIYFIQAPGFVISPKTNWQQEFRKHFPIKEVMDPAANSHSCTVREFKHIMSHTPVSQWNPFSRTPSVAQFVHYAKSDKYAQDIFACLTRSMHRGFKFETWYVL